MTYETEEEVEIIYVREGQVKEIINQFMKGEKALSFSSLKAFSENPQEFIQYQLREKKTTAAMAFGTMVHCLILEPDDFENRYAVMDDTSICEQIGGAKPRAASEYKKWKANFQFNNEGKETVPIKDFNAAASIANNARFNRAFQPIFELCTEREQYVEWVWEGLKFRGYIDGRAPISETAPRAKFDIKTCADANPEKFRRDIIKNKYYLQAFMYNTSDGDDQYCPYYIVALDKKGGVSVHQLDETLLEYGRKEYKRLIDAFNKCLIKGAFDQSYEFWSDRKSGVFNCELPAYLQ